MPLTSPLWPRGGAVNSRPRPLASPGTAVALRRRLGALCQSGGQSHTNHTPACVPAASPPRVHASGEWHSPQYSSHELTAPLDVRSRAAEKNPYGSQVMRRSWPAGRVARRRWRVQPPATHRSCGPVLLGRSRRPDRCGQAPKGAGGMPRRHQIRAWKAAKSPGELPNERRARNARTTRGTETSQYPEERKSTETPSVAASERGPAQTGRDTARGCGAGITRKDSAEPKSFGKGHHSG